MDSKEFIEVLLAGFIAASGAVGIFEIVYRRSLKRNRKSNSLQPENSGWVVPLQGLRAAAGITCVVLSNSAAQPPSGVIQLDRASTTAPPVFLLANARLN